MKTPCFGILSVLAMIATFLANGCGRKLDPPVTDVVREEIQLRKTMAIQKAGYRVELRLRAFDAAKDKGVYIGQTSETKFVCEGLVFDSGGQPWTTPPAAFGDLADPELMELLPGSDGATVTLYGGRDPEGYTCSFFYTGGRLQKRALVNEALGEEPVTNDYSPEPPAKEKR